MLPGSGSLISRNFELMRLIFIQESLLWLMVVKYSWWKGWRNLMKKPEVDVNLCPNPVQLFLFLYCPLSLSMTRHLRNACQEYFLFPKVKTNLKIHIAVFYAWAWQRHLGKLWFIIRSQMNLDKRCITLVVQYLDPGHRAKLLKRVEERIGVGQIWRDVRHKENNLWDTLVSNILLLRCFKWSCIN